MIGMIVNQALRDMLARPLDQRRANRTAVIEDERHRAGQFHRATNPPTASGRGVQRVLTVAVIDQHTDAPFKAAFFFRLRHGLHEQGFEVGYTSLIRASLLRQIEELVAVIEGKTEHFVPRFTSWRDTMQARERSVPIRPAHADRVGVRGIEEIAELGGRWHGGRATMTRYN